MEKRVERSRERERSKRFSSLERGSSAFKRVGLQRICSSIEWVPMGLQLPLAKAGQFWIQKSETVPCTKRFCSTSLFPRDRSSPSTIYKIRDPVSSRTRRLVACKTPIVLGGQLSRENLEHWLMEILIETKAKEI